MYSTTMSYKAFTYQPKHEVMHELGAQYNRLHETIQVHVGLLKAAGVACTILGELHPNRQAIVDYADDMLLDAYKQFAKWIFLSHDANLMIPIYYD